MNVNSSVFPLPLLQLVLCGGKGLAPAWGPLHHVHTHEDEVYPWDPVILAASSLPSHLRDDGARIEMWSLPLNADSPWPARLALVAAWMVGNSGGSSALIHAGINLTLMTVTARPSIIQAMWATESGLRLDSQVPWPHLPTLPTHLDAHPPSVALLLALYDVPEIRARVDAASTGVTK